VGYIVSLALGAGFAFMLSPYPRAAYGFFVAGPALVLAKFWTSEEMRKQSPLFKAVVTLGLLTLAVALLLWTHAISRAVQAGRSEQLATAGTEASGSGTTPVGNKDLHERKAGDQTVPLIQNSSQKTSPSSVRTTSIANAESHGQLQEFTLVMRNDVATPQFYVNDHASIPMSYSSGIAALKLPTGSYLVRAEYPNWTCSAFITLPLEKQRPVPANCTSK